MLKGDQIPAVAAPWHALRSSRISRWGHLRSRRSEKGEPFVAILRRFEMERLEADGRAAPDEDEQKYSMGLTARCSEVRVDEDTGEVRVTRFLGVYDCGRIINPKTASSQCRGGITMGIGMAL